MKKNISSKKLMNYLGEMSHDFRERADQSALEGMYKEAYLYQALSELIKDEVKCAIYHDLISDLTN